MNDQKLVLPKELRTSNHIAARVDSIYYTYSYVFEFGNFSQSIMIHTICKT